MIEKKDNLGRHRWWLEVAWWMATFLLCLLILFPILQQTNRYPFVSINVIFILVFTTLFRYIFLWKYNVLARRQYLKITLVFLCIPLLFNMVNNLNYFLTHLDDFGHESYLGHLDTEIRNNLVIYIRSEMLLFGVGSIITSFIFPFRLMVSVWRQRNKGTV